MFGKTGLWSFSRRRKEEKEELSRTESPRSLYPGVDGEKLRSITRPFQGERSDSSRNVSKPWSPKTRLARLCTRVSALRSADS